MLEIEFGKFSDEIFHDQVRLARCAAGEDGGLQAEAQRIDRQCRGEGGAQPTILRRREFHRRGGS